MYASSFFTRISRLSTYSPAMYKKVCLGGTFDGIHGGHKILFGDAIKICSERLIVGVTGTNMIEKKILWELIAPVEERISRVRDYLQETNPDLTYHVVQINDLYGPTIIEEDLDCIVVSNETIKGANKVNEARKQKGWKELAVHVVNLLEDMDTSHDVKQMLRENKISSSLMRVNKLGTMLKEPEEGNLRPKNPYIIGLTGGIASGKTTIGKYLESIGFGYISFDLLAHKTYEEVGSPVYNKIVEYFGDTILNSVSRQIDRPKLGKIVFSDRQKLNMLNEMVWPATYALADDLIEKLKSKHDVIIVEAALLIESQQYKRFHQLWTSIIPPEEAVRRLVEIRGLTQEEAEKRVNSQIDNLTRVRASNAVFCSLWDHQFTQQQVDKCVKELRDKYLKTS